MTDPAVTLDLNPLVLDPRQPYERQQQIRARVACHLMLRWPGGQPCDPGAFRAATGPGPLCVRVVRVGPRSLGPAALAAALLPVRQELIRWLGGRPDRLTWAFEQVHGPQAVRVEIARVAP